MSAPLDALDRLDQRLPARLRRPELVLLGIALVFAGAAAVRADRLATPAAERPLLASPAPSGHAVLWFATPLTPEQAAAALEASGAEVVAMRVSLAADGAPATAAGLREIAVPQGAAPAARLELAMEALAEELLAEAEELRGYGATTDMEDFAAQYQTDAERLEALAARDPAACACIAALVVRGPVPTEPGVIPGVGRVEMHSSP